jgi:uncharacterized protein (TIGR03435 family)
MSLFRITRTFISLTAACIPLCAMAQSSPLPTPTFDVASIRQNKTDPPAWRMAFTPDGVSGRDVTLEWVLRPYAYGPDQQWSSSGPAWLDTARFDIEAKFDVAAFPHPTIEQRRAMLQALLADRFKLKIHHEQRDFPLYTLVVPQGGPKLTIAQVDQAHMSPIYGPMCQLTRMGHGDTKLQGCSMADLADHLTQIQRAGARRIVQDATGLTGRYTFDLTWSPDPTSSAEGGPSAEPGFLGPSLETALRDQLGLKIVATHGPLDVIVIDHVEMPSEN